MPIPEHILRFWNALDERIAQVEPAWWGAVVTDARFPAIWDINYARVEAAASDLALSEVADALLPALAEMGLDTFHVVCFHPEDVTGLLVELSTLGHTLSWDLVMDLAAEPTVGPADVRVESLDPGDELWSRVEGSLALFGNDPTVCEQLRALEEATFAAGHKRWLGVRDDEGGIVALAALVLLESVGYLDNVATFPEARGRGSATAIVARAIEMAHEAGADHVSLFADPDDVAVVRMYERLGFRDVGRLASTRGPLADVPGKGRRTGSGTYRDVEGPVNISRTPTQTRCAPPTLPT